MWPRMCGALEKKRQSDTSYKDIVKASSNDHLMTSKQIEKVSIKQELSRLNPDKPYYNFLVS